MVRLLFAILPSLLIMAWSARAGDRTENASGIPASPAAPLLTDTNNPDPCSFGALSLPVTLADAVSRTLCGNPKTRGAWATIKLYAAAVRVGQDNYLPTLNAKAAETESSTQTRIKYDRALDTSTNDLYPAASLTLSWVLYDFGQRSNQLESARELLAAARANLDLNLQQVFLQAAGDYYDAQAALASLDANLEIEELTRKSADAAHIRVQKGVAPVSDELQAQTAHALAVVNRVKAAAELKIKGGALAGDMAMDPDRMITVPQADPDINARGSFAESLHKLIGEAKQNHPSVTVAERNLDAAKADEKAARAHGRPTISIVGGISRSNESLTPNLGSPSVPGSVSDKTIGIQIDVPISDALWKRGRVAQAHAQVEVQREALYGAEQLVAHDVWKTYTDLQADTDNLTNSEALLDSARMSFQSTQHRYEGGVGNILELLSAQSAYANAQQQRIRALSDWRYARLALGASLGRLGLWAIE
jgi:outer membrane protein